jgi:ATP-dependent Clp protease ATP-binding subunit ClpA
MFVTPLSHSSYAVLTLMLQVFDEGRLTDGQGTTITIVSNTITVTL